MGLVVFYAAAMLFVGACRKQEEPAAPSRTAAATSTTPPPAPARINLAVQLAKGEISRCELGTALGASGNVEDAKTTFARKDPLYVSMWLNEAPEELQVSAKFLDERGKEAAVVRKDDAGGQKVVTLKLDRKLSAGAYKLEGYWGGNLGCEKQLTIE